MSQPPVPPSYPPTPPASPPSAYGTTGGNPYSPPGPESATNVLAIVSLVSAFFVSLVAVITGHLALSQIKRTGEKGRGLAIAGLVIGYVGIAAGLVAIGILIFSLIAGVGLFAVFVNEAQKYSTIDPYPTSDPYSTEDPFATPGPGAAGDLTFDAGDDLSPSTVVQFNDPFFVNSDWTSLSPADGNGNWSYTDPSGKCSVAFHQGAIDPASVVTGDDAATTDALMANYLKVTSAEVASHVANDIFAYGSPGADTTVDTRSISGTDDDGSNWVVAARAFGVIEAGLFVDVTCKPGGDIDSTYTEVTTKAAIVTG